MYTPDSKSRSSAIESLDYDEVDKSTLQKINNRIDVFARKHTISIGVMASFVFLGGVSLFASQASECRAYPATTPAEAPSAADCEHTPYPKENTEELNFFINDDAKTLIQVTTPSNN